MISVTVLQYNAVAWLLLWCMSLWTCNS